MDSQSLEVVRDLSIYAIYLYNGQSNQNYSRTFYIFKNRFLLFFYRLNFMNLSFISLIMSSICKIHALEFSGLVSFMRLFNV
jgi:hypothetical protein